jgi:DNA-binding MarR family transcriptional regulator
LAADSSAKEERSMRLLQPKIRILFYVYKKGKVADNISALARNLSYKKDSWVNNRVNELLTDGYLERVVIGNNSYFRLTEKGRKKIQMVVLPKVLAAVIALLSLIPLVWAFGETVLKIELSNVTLMIGGIALLSLAFALYFVIDRLENQMLRLKSKPHRSS